VCAGELRASVREPVDLDEHERDGAAGDEHRGRVDDVLAGRAEMDVVGCLAADCSAYLADERLRRIPDRPALFCEPRRVVELDEAGLSDPTSGVLRDEPDCGACHRERLLRVQHPLYPRPIRGRIAQALRDEDGRERRHTAKNVV
jgi:hypothetical protein